MVDPDEARRVIDQIAAVDAATSGDELRRLAADPAPEVRAAVARTFATPLDVLFTLARDASRDVRLAVAIASGSRDVLGILAEDDDDKIARTARYRRQSLRWRWLFQPKGHPDGYGHRR